MRIKSDSIRQSIDCQQETFLKFYGLMVNIGPKVLEVVKNKRIPVVEFAEEIQLSKQNVYDLFKRSSIDTLTLWRISKALKFDFFKVFSDELAIEANSNRSPNEFESVISNQAIKLSHMEHELLTVFKINEILKSKGTRNVVITLKDGLEIKGKIVETELDSYTQVRNLVYVTDDDIKQYKSNSQFNVNEDPELYNRRVPVSKIKDVVQVDTAEKK